MPRISSRCPKRTSNSLAAAAGKRSSGSISLVKGCWVSPKCWRYKSVLLSGLEVSQCQAGGRVVEPAVGVERLGGVIALDEAVGVEVDTLGLLDFAPLEVDVHGPATALRIEAQSDGLADQRGIDLVHDPVQADRAVALDLAFLLEEKQIVEIRSRTHEADVLSRHRPAVERSHAVEPLVGVLVVLAFDPGPQPPIERVERGRVGLG